LYAANNVNGHLITDSTGNLNNVGAAASNILTDGEMSVSILAGISDGTGAGHTKSTTTGGQVSVSRAADAGLDSYVMEVPIPTRTTALQGIRPTSLKINYEVSISAVDDVFFNLKKVTKAADGGAHPASITILMGDVAGGDPVAEYDTAHDTAGERGSIKNHTVTITDADPVWLDADESLVLVWFTDGDAGPTGIVSLKHVNMQFDRLMVDRLDR
jgi:hypothetical protein